MPAAQMLNILSMRILVFLIPAIVGIFTVYLLTGKDGEKLKTLIWMHVFSFTVFIMMSTSHRFKHILVVLGTWAFVILVQTFWFYFKNYPFSLQATAAVMLFMNVIEAVLRTFSALVIAQIISRLI